MQKYIINLIYGLINVAIAIGVVYFMGWLLAEDVDSIVGWVALGMAATSNRT
jgi:hypothetical protein